MPTLNWLNCKEALTLSQNAPYRLLEAVPELSYGDEDKENMLILGNNLDGTKAGRGPCKQFISSHSLLTADHSVILSILLILSGFLSLFL